MRAGAVGAGAVRHKPIFFLLRGPGPSYGEGLSNNRPTPQNSHANVRINAKLYHHAKISDQRRFPVVDSNFVRNPVRNFLVIVRTFLDCFGMMLYEKINGKVVT